MMADSVKLVMHANCRLEGPLADCSAARPAPNAPVNDCTATWVKGRPGTG